jgi:ABC-type polysaccharide/polyol phosphate transport system ATPase subunit
MLTVVSHDFRPHYRHPRQPSRQEIHHRRTAGKYLTFRDAIVSSVKAPFRRFTSHSSQAEFRALKDVSFDVEQGGVVGIIGRNGAGKAGAALRSADGLW